VRAPRSVRRAGVALAALGVARASWRRPTVELVVEPGGRAFLRAGVRGTFTPSPLPDTVHVALRGNRATVRVTNRDAAWRQLGAFGAGPCQSRDYVVSAPAVLEGVCAAHPAGAITYLIR
jgi:hypothetical protein